MTFSVSWAQLSTDPKKDVILQGFWWDSYQDANVSAEGGLYNYLKARASQLKAAGFDMVWTPPPSEGDGMAYFPRRLYYFNNAHGTESQLKAYWSKLVFSGQGQPPKVVESSAEILTLVAANPNMIGFVDAAEVTPNVKVVGKF